MLENQNQQFDLILMDWNMPGLDGIETTQLIKERYKEHSPYIIMVSAFKQESIINIAQQAGIDSFIQKPVNPSIFNDMLSDLFFGTKKMEEKNLENSSLKTKLTTLKGSRILLAEDNQTNQEIITGLLDGSGIIVDIAENGKEAVDLVKSNDYELIFMDIQMPIMDGYKATQIIRQIDKAKSIPIVALTANAMKEDVEKTKEAGMNKHLNKPIEVEKLYSTLLEFISKKGEELVAKENKIDDIVLPEFKEIDTEHALNLVMGDKKIFLNILRGLYEFKDIDLENIDNNEEFKRITHTIKGISASAGALALHKIAKELDETQDKNYIPKFYIEFKKVIQEIDEKLISLDTDTKREKLDKEKRDELFTKLKEAIATKRAKNTKPLIEEIDRYILSKEDKELYDKIKQFIKKFKFKDALELL